MRSHGPDSRSESSQNPLTLSQLALTACYWTRFEFLFVTTRAIVKQSLHRLVRSLYLFAAGNGVASEFTTDLAVRLLRHQLVIHSQARSSVCSKTTCAMGLQSKDSPCRSRGSPLGVAVDSPLAAVSVKSTQLTIYDRKIGQQDDQQRGGDLPRRRRVPGVA